MGRCWKRSPKTPTCPVHFGVLPLNFPIGVSVSSDKSSSPVV